MNNKKALIAVNFIGFVNFLWDDIDILEKIGYDITVVGDIKIRGGDTLDILKRKNVNVINVKIDSKSPLSKNNVKAYIKYKKILSKGHFNLIHCHTPIVGFLMRMAAMKYRRKGTKVVYTTHGLAYTHLSSRKEYLLYHTMESFVSRFCDAIITINLEDYESAKKLHCKDVYHVNGVGVDIEKYKNIIIDKKKYRENIGVPVDKIMILSIGELSVRKNHIAIVNAIAQLKNKEKYVFAICGSKMTGSGTGSFIQESAKEKDVNVIFLGFRSDIPQIVHCADIGAIPSIREGLGLSGIETLCAGVPVIGSEVQGIREYVINGNTGFLCDPHDTNAFAMAIEKLSDKGYRDSLRENCLEIVNKFDKSISIRQRELIYRKILCQIDTHVF